MFMNYGNPEFIMSRIVNTHPRMKVSIIETEYGPAIKIQGKDAKYTAGYYTRERYLDGFTNTNWGYVRHGLGHIIPLYENPMEGIV